MMNTTEKSSGNGKRSLRLWGAGVAVTVLVVGGAAGLWWQGHSRGPSVPMTYRADGYGGFEPTAPKATASSIASASPIAATAIAKSAAPKAIAAVALPLQNARDAYQRGDYKAATVAAKTAVQAASQAGSKRATAAPVATRESVAQAQHLLAFAAARSGDLKTAREHFAKAKEIAVTLPQVSPSPLAPGEMPAPTLAEDSAYQHAVCTMALGDKAGAEQEFVAFIKAYPDSPLVHAAIGRVGRMHGGDIPKEAEAIWTQAQVVAKRHTEERARDASLCGPECLAELLRRQGKSVPVETLAQEMKTDGQGTTLFSLLESVKRHGYASASGVHLTAKGLKEQSLPLIALISPGHYVLVDAIQVDGSVTLWDANAVTGAPDAAGKTSESGESSKERHVSESDWKRTWSGVALLCAKPSTTASTASVVASTQEHNPSVR